MIVTETNLKGVMLITPARFVDDRGFFSEIYNEATYKSIGISCKFVQDNFSKSLAIGTLRGLHFQSPPDAQAKLVRCSKGSIFDVAVDIRKGSSTYGKWVGFELSHTNRNLLFVPEGFAHGFLTLEPNSEVIYKCSNYYAPESEGAILWNDESLAIDWPLDDKPILNEKDASAGLLKDFNTPFGNP